MTDKKQDTKYHLTYYILVTAIAAVLFIGLFLPTVGGLSGLVYIVTAFIFLTQLVFAGYKESIKVDGYEEYINLVVFNGFPLDMRFTVFLSGWPDILIQSLSFFLQESKNGQ